MRNTLSSKVARALIIFLLLLPLTDIAGVNETLAFCRQPIKDCNPLEGRCDSIDAERRAFIAVTDFLKDAPVPGIGAWILHKVEVKDEDLMLAYVELKVGNTGSLYYAFVIHNGKVWGGEELTEDMVQQHCGGSDGKES